MRRTVWRIVWPLLCAWAVLPGCISLDSFLFSPTPSATDADLMAGATGIPPELIEQVPTGIVADDGTVVNGYLLTHAADDGTDADRHSTGLLYSHGNAVNIDGYSQRVQQLWQQGYTVLIYDYRGFGKTPGKPHETGVYQDGRAARAYLASRHDLGLQADRIVLYGWSLGCAISTELAVESPPMALILEAPFASVFELTQDDSDLSNPRPWFADGLFDNRAKIPQYAGPLFIMHGAADVFVQPKYGEEISAAAAHANPNIFWLVANAGHDTVPCQNPTLPATAHGGCSGGFSLEYAQRVAAFIDQATP